MDTTNAKRTRQTTDEGGGALTTEGSGNIDQIREILFGVQMEEYEQRLTLLEERLGQEAADLRATTTSRLDTLEKYMKGELETLTGSLKGERSERLKAVKGVSREISGLGESLERRIARVDEALAERTSELSGTIAEHSRELRDSLLEQSKSLREELAQARESLTASLAGEVAHLDSRKADRLQVATLLADAAASLGAESVAAPEES